MDFYILIGFWYKYTYITGECKEITQACKSMKSGLNLHHTHRERERERERCSHLNLDINLDNNQTMSPILFYVHDFRLTESS